MDWTDRLKDWADDAVDGGGGDGIFDEVGDFLGDQVDDSWAQDLVDAGTDGVVDKLDGTVSQPVDDVAPMPAVEERVVSFEADPGPSHFDEAMAAADAFDDSVDDTSVRRR